MKSLPDNLPPLPKNAVYLGKGEEFEALPDHAYFDGWAIMDGDAKWGDNAIYRGHGIDLHYAAPRDSEVARLNGYGGSHTEEVRERLASIPVFSNRESAAPTQSETPRTDAIVYDCNGALDIVPADFARTLEHENAELRAKLAEVERERDATRVALKQSKEECAGLQWTLENTIPAQAVDALTASEAKVRELETKLERARLVNYELDCLALRVQAQQLREALERAKDHLEYSGYGDSWERECAGDLPQVIAAALAATEPKKEGA